MVLDRNSTRTAWALIAVYFAQRMEQSEKTGGHWYSELSSSSINDAIQSQYKRGFITEAQRDQMRAHVITWMGSPETLPSNYTWRGVDDYARYSCGMWAPSVGPQGNDEHAIILMTVEILCEEAV